MLWSSRSLKRMMQSPTKKRTVGIHLFIRISLYVKPYLIYNWVKKNKSCCTNHSVYSFLHFELSCFHLLVFVECSSPEYKQKKAHFYVYCEAPCQSIQNGKLRVRCSLCKAGAFTVDRDPCCWDDVLRPEQVSGTCQMEGCDHSWAEFYFKCARHSSRGENDSTLPLYLVKSNFKQIQCLACMDVR